MMGDDENGAKQGVDMPTHVIFDTDAGTDIDDLYALALILNHPNLNLLGVTTVSGDTQARARLVAKMLRLADRPDVPVAAGIEVPAILAKQGVDAASYKRLTHTDLVGTDDPEYGQTYDDAIDFILGQLDKAETPITIVATGPWTNVAEVLRRANETQISMIADLALMGGEVHLLHRGSNVKSDPEAADFILKQRVPTFLATWSISRQLEFPMAEVHALTCEPSSPFVQALRAATDTWWGDGMTYKPGPVCYDVIPVFWAAGEREAIACIKLDEIPVELNGTYTRGMMVVHPWKRMGAERVSSTASEYVTLTDAMNVETLKQRYIDLVFR
jgi:inosine-uridine nucleoside N-ribohydrolase